MLLIRCPWCGLREQTEFSCGGEAHIVRPLQPDTLSDDEWADYLFMRENTKGWQNEQWFHSGGCRRWFNAQRHTVTYKFGASYRPTDPKPEDMD